MTERYFVPHAIESTEISLEGSEAHHLLHVMRLRTGAVVTLFDGRGAEFSARIVSASRRDVRLEVVSRQLIDREASRIVTLGVAFPKGPRQAWLVEKATEIGVHRLVPLETEQSRVSLEAKSIDRLRRTVVETSKQCGRNRLMEVTLPVRFRDFISSEDHAWRLIAHRESHDSCGSDQQPSAQQGDRPVLVAVGPPGGFHTDEVQAATKLGWELWDLGPRTLRTETAALAIVCSLLLARQDAGRDDSEESCG